MHVTSGSLRKGTLILFNGYLTQQKEILQSFRRHPLVLAGDGRCDSQEHNAKCGTYSLTEVTTEKIVDFPLVEVSEVANPNCMEKEGLKRCLDMLERDGQLTNMHVSYGQVLNVYWVQVPYPG